MPDFSCTFSGNLVDSATVFPGMNTMNAKILIAFAAVALLAACSQDNSPLPPGGPVNGNGAGMGGPGMGGAGMGGVSSSGINAVPGSQEDLTANVGDRVFFDLDQSALRADGQATLDKQAAWLQQYSQDNVQIAGNCDERGTEEYDIALGQRRADAARDYLVAKGVAASRITTISYGKDRPVALGSFESAWAQNRNAITSVR
jgi:peptidoglycan-associated lipoprotein